MNLRGSLSKVDWLVCLVDTWPTPITAYKDPIFFLHINSALCRYINAYLFLPSQRWTSYRRLPQCCCWAPVSVKWCCSVAGLPAAGRPGSCSAGCWWGGALAKPCLTSAHWLQAATKERSAQRVRDGIQNLHYSLHNATKVPQQGIELWTLQWCGARLNH